MTVQTGVLPPLQWWEGRVKNLGDAVEGDSCHKGGQSTCREAQRPERTHGGTGERTAMARE